MTNYIGIIHKDGSSDYGVSFPDFPGCVSAGSSMDEVRTMAEEALSFHVAGMIEDGDPVPEPSSLETAMLDPDNRDGVAILVPLGLAPKTVSINITLPEDALREIDAHAEQNGFTRSGFLVTAARKAMADAG